MFLYRAQVLREMEECHTHDHQMSWLPTGCWGSLLHLTLLSLDAGEACCIDFVEKCIVYFNDYVQML